MSILSKMSLEGFKLFCERSLKGYSKDFAIANEISDALAEAACADQFKELLPEGFDTPDNFFYNVILEGKVSGWLWLNLKSKFNVKSLFIYDIFLEPEARGKGLGTKVLKELDQIAIEMKVSRINLHVFGHNKKAFNLYQKLGYVETGIVMRKDLD